MSYVNVKIDPCCAKTLQTLKKEISINITKNKMLWAMIYSNRMNREFKNAQDFKKYIQWRKAQMDFIFDFTESKLKVHKYIERLEKSYLNSIGFDLGMILANIVCKDILGLNHLYHLNVGKYLYNSQASVDYISQNRNGYFAIEAKGTMSKNWYGKKKAEEQLRKVMQINHKTPYKYAVLTRCKNLIIESRLIDPISNNKENIQIPDDFWKYQKEICELLDKKHELFHSVKMKYIEVDNVLFGLICSKDDIFGKETDGLKEVAIGNKIYLIEFFEDGSVIGIEKGN